MNFEEYQRMSRKTAMYPDLGKNYAYIALGLTGEAGEVANKVKKIYRDDNSVLTDAKREEIKKELGDILWYIAQMATEMNLSLDEIAQNNIVRLYSRLERGTINGDGDNR